MHTTQWITVNLMFEMSQIKKYLRVLHVCRSVNLHTFGIHILTPLSLIQIWLFGEERKSDRCFYKYMLSGTSDKKPPPPAAPARGHRGTCLLEPMNCLEE